MLVSINYDLVSKVKIANGSLISPTIQPIIKVFPLWSSLVLISSLNLGESPIELITKTILGIEASLPIIGMYTFVNAFAYKDDIKNRAMKSLKDLSYKLSAQGVETSDILLVDSVQDGLPRYKFRFNEGKFQDILQEKYILIPTYNNGETERTSVLQEHRVFPPSDEYVLTIGSRSRKRALKPVFTSGL